MIKANVIGSCFLIMITLILCLLIGLILLLNKYIILGLFFLIPTVLFILICVGVLIWEEITYKRILMDIKKGKE